MSPVLYGAARPSALRIIPLDALTLIYHRASGITHIVDAPVPEILEALGDGPASSETLMARLAERFELGDPDPVALAMRLDELAAAGLVERLCAM